jgi:hypothetical protein
MRGILKRQSGFRSTSSADTGKHGASSRYKLRHWPPGTDNKPSVPPFLGANRQLPQAALRYGRTARRDGQPGSAIRHAIDATRKVESSSVTKPHASTAERIWSAVNRNPGWTLASILALYLAVACGQAATKLLWCDELITLAIARQGSLAAI